MGWESQLRLRPARPEDAAACAAIFNDWVDATDWMPRVHPPDDVERHYREHVLAGLRGDGGGGRRARWRGFSRSTARGSSAGLYLAPEARGRGVGAALVEAAKARRPEGLTLWTFVANAGARRFYAREGFVEVGRTEGENEEGLPDVLLGVEAGVKGRAERAAGAGGGGGHPRRSGTCWRS